MVTETSTECWACKLGAEAPANLSFAAAIAIGYGFGASMARPPKMCLKHAAIAAAVIASMQGGAS